MYLYIQQNIVGWSGGFWIFGQIAGFLVASNSFLTLLALVLSRLVL